MKTLRVDLFHNCMTASWSSCPQQNSALMFAQDSMEIPLHNIEADCPLEFLRGVLSRASSSTLLEKTAVVFGIQSDPLLPFGQKFDTALQAIELIASYKPGKFCIQTRSPLIVVTAPILRPLGARVSVTIALESVDDEANQRYTPSLPRPSERLQTAKALKDIGIPVRLQVAPVFRAPVKESALKELVDRIHECSTEIRLVAFEHILSERSSHKFSSKAARSHILPSGLCVDSLSMLSEKLFSRFSDTPLEVISHNKCSEAA